MEKRAKEEMVKRPERESFLLFLSSPFLHLPIYPFPLYEKTEEI